MQGSKPSKCITRILFGCSDAEDDKKGDQRGNVRCGTIKINHASLTSVFANALCLKWRSSLCRANTKMMSSTLGFSFCPPSSEGLSQGPLHFQLLSDVLHKRVGGLVDRVDGWSQKVGFSPSPPFCNWWTPSSQTESFSAPYGESATMLNPRNRFESHKWHTRMTASGQMFAGEDRS